MSKKPMSPEKAKQIIAKEEARANARYFADNYGPRAKREPDTRPYVHPLAPIEDKSQWDELASEAEARGKTFEADYAAKRGTPASYQLRVIELQDRSAKAKAAVLEARAATLKKKAEDASDIYVPGSQNSWVRDLAVVTAADPGMVRMIPNLRSRQSMFAMQAAGGDLHLRGEAQAALTRLTKYGNEVRSHVLARTEFGLQAIESLRSMYRWKGYTAFEGEVEHRIGDDLTYMAETRDAATTVGTMSFFAPPVTFTQEFQLYRTFSAPILSVLNSQPLPSHGMQVAVPSLSSPIGVTSVGELLPWLPSTSVTVGTQYTAIVAGQEYLFQVTTAGTTGTTMPNWSAHLTVGNTVTDGSLTVWTNTARPAGPTYVGSGGGLGAGLLGGDATYSQVLTASGQLTLAQQILDRNAFGGQFDQFVARQLAREIATEQGKNVLSAILGVAGLQAHTSGGSSAYSGNAFLADYAAASQLLGGSEGIASSPDYVGAKSAIIWGLLSYVPTASGLPFFGSHSSLETTGAAEGKVANLVGGAGLYQEEGLLPLESGSGIVLVGSGKNGALWFNSAPVLNVYPAWSPAGLTAIIESHQYYAGAVLHNGAGFVSVTGSTQYPA